MTSQTAWSPRSGFPDVMSGFPNSVWGERSRSSPFAAHFRVCSGKRNGDIAWPISFAENGIWYMNQHNADLWKQSRQ